MSQRRKLVVTLALISLPAVSVVGCATPGPLISLRPYRDDVIWVAGRASIQKQEAGIRIAAAFEHQDGDNLAIRVEVENRTDQRFDIDPSNVGFTVCGAADNPTESCSPYHPVIDPERVLTELENMQSIEAASAKNDEALGATVLLLTLVGDVGTIASGRGRATTGLKTAVVANQLENDVNRHDTALAATALQRQRWSNVALRRNTLFPGTGFGGLVYVPIDPKAHYVWLAVGVPGGRRFPFCFEQVVTPIPSPYDRPTESRGAARDLVGRDDPQAGRARPLVRKD